jgi:hypothetical protein
VKRPLAPPEDPLIYFLIFPAEISFPVEKGVFWWFDYCLAVEATGFAGGVAVIYR